MVSTAENRPELRALVEWAPIIVGLLALYLPSFMGLAAGAWHEDEYAHGPIILVVILWLLWDRRSVLIQPARNVSLILGAGILILGLLFYIVGRSQGVSVMEVGSLALVLAGMLLCMRGRSATQTYWFMLLFVVYLVPLPGVFVDAITGPLKRYVSIAAEQLLYGAGYPVARNGVVLRVGQYQLMVADACSGINSMFSLSAIGLLYLYLMQYQSKLHNAVVVLSLFPIAYCANVVRVVTLVLVTFHFGDEIAQGFVHKFSGMVLFVVSLGLVLLLDFVLVRLTRLKKA